MSEETMDLTPQLTLTPDSAATQPQAPSLTLEPNADQQQAQAAQQAAQAQREANAVKIDESMLNEAERKMVDDFAQKIDITTPTWCSSTARRPRRTSPLSQKAL